MNRNEYDSGNYSGYRQQPPNHTYPYRNPSMGPNTRNDYEVDSMMSTRSMPQREYSWERQSRVDSPYERRGSDISRLRSQYTRVSPFQDHRYDSKMDVSPTRREYSPLRKVSKGFDGVFKGFTTALPGNDPGYMANAADMMEHGSMRTPSSRRYSEVDRASLYRGLSNAGSMSAPIGAAASMTAGSDLYANNYRYRDSRPEYATSNPSYMVDDYPPEPTSRYLHDSNKRYDDPSASYSAPSVSSANGRRSADCYRWDTTAATPPPQPPPPAPCWDVEEEPRMSDQPLSPRTFKRECQRAFKEARAQRMRNLEEGLYGKCDWATFDAKYC
ncbi:hypothetical protein V9T40_002298 [Parthenolecanium corni]|uniref:Uncharacterized protein n=1 Tax=Parthenolecanium corni TaxID=536013 RepID=A0AAN9Y593_9HEMI